MNMVEAIYKVLDVEGRESRLLQLAPLPDLSLRRSDIPILQRFTNISTQQHDLLGSLSSHRARIEFNVLDQVCQGFEHHTS